MLYALFVENTLFLITIIMIFVNTVVGKMRIVLMEEA